MLLLLRQGQANAQIALELHIGIETVRTHARSIYRKLGVTSRRALIALPSAPRRSAADGHQRPAGDAVGEPDDAPGS